MKVIFGLGHPAHYHLYKYVISELIQDGAIIKVVISEKDVLGELLQNAGIPFVRIATSFPDESLFSKAKKLYNSQLN